MDVQCRAVRVGKFRATRRNGINKNPAGGGGVENILMLRRKGAKGVL